MAHTNSTTNYNLPQFISTDKPAWLTDFNGAMSDIDTAIYTASTDAATADGKADTALGNAATAEADAKQAKGYTPGETFKVNGTVFGIANAAGTQISVLIIMPRDVWTNNVDSTLTDATVTNIRCDGVSYTSSNVTASISNGNNLKLTVTPASNVPGNKICAVGFAPLEMTFTAHTP